MDRVFRIERKNPASYLSWLSQDVVDYYLINRYALFWLKDFHWDIQTELLPDIPIVIPTVATRLGATSWDDIQAVFTSDGLVQLNQGHSRKIGFFHLHQGKYYVHCGGLGSGYTPEPDDLFNNHVYVFGTDFQYQGVFAEQIKEIILVGDHLVLIPLLQTVGETQVIIYDSHSSGVRQLILPLSLYQIRLRYVGHGLIMILPYQSTSLLLFSTETGMLIRTLPIKSYDSYIPMENLLVTSSGQISVVRGQNQLMVFTPR